MHMIKKRQLDCPKTQSMSSAAQFYSLVFVLSRPNGFAVTRANIAKTWKVGSHGLRSDHLSAIRAPQNEIREQLLQIFYIAVCEWRRSRIQRIVRAAVRPEFLQGKGVDTVFVQ